MGQPPRGKMMSSEEKPKKIFISHRFADKPIADVINRNLARWGFDDIYQAGGPGSGPRVGDSLTDDLRDALENVDLVILVYTFTDEDWSWCMWECGVATHPRQADATRVVVFRCSRYDSPRQFAQQVNVDVDPDGIHNFTKQLHRNDDFFKGRPAHRPKISDENLAGLSKAFYEELRPVIPTGQREERYRWDRFTLALEPPTDRLNLEVSEDEVVNLIQSELFVTQPFGNALAHFGYANLEDNLKLSNLVERWTGETRNRENASEDWIKGLCLEIRRAINAYPAEPNWQELNSVAFSGMSYFPVLNHVRVLPDGSMEFDVYFYAVK
jgi:TIR domain